MKQNTRIVRAAIALGASAGVLLASPFAHAQQRQGDLGQQGQFILSGDRLFSLFAYDNVTQDDLVPGGLPNGETSQTTTNNQTTMSFFYGQNGNAPESFFSVPRVGLDYVFLPNMTLGGDVVLLLTLGGSTSHEADFPNMTNRTSASNPSTTGFGIAPRYGYILPLNDMFSLWLRGGFSYYTATTKYPTGPAAGTVTASTGLDQFGIDLEPQVVLTVIPHVGFTAGLACDIPLAGGHSAESDTANSSSNVSAHSSIFYLGLELGMLAHF
jgi:hypothetical protein